MNNNDGYIIFDTDIPSDLIDEVVRYSDSVLNDKVKRVQDAWKHNDSVKQLSLYPTIIHKIREVYGKEPLPFQTLNFKVGTTQRIHSDTLHFHSHPPRNMCGVWVALEDITEDNGPLFYYPKTHLEPCLTYRDIGLPEKHPESYPAYEEFLQNMVDYAGYERREATIKKGQAIIWDANLLHGGSPIKNPELTRYSQVTHYFFESEYYYTPALTRKGKLTYRKPDWIK